MRSSRVCVVQFGREGGQRKNGLSCTVVHTLGVVGHGMCDAQRSTQRARVKRKARQGAKMESRDSVLLGQVLIAKSSQ
jgi:hypothetical protein